MKIKKSIQCTTAPLEDYIANGGGIDFRLDEPAWQNLNIGDIVQYWEDFSGWDQEPAPHARKVLARLEDKVFATSFAELIDKLPISFLRHETKEDIIANLRRWWSPEKEGATGVLSMEIKLIESTK